LRWFKSFGLVYLPVSVLGWLATLLMASFAAQVFLFFNSRAHSVSDLLYAVFPYWVPTFLLWAWLAGRTSAERGRPA